MLNYRISVTLLPIKSMTLTMYLPTHEGVWKMENWLYFFHIISVMKTKLKNEEWECMHQIKFQKSQDLTLF